MSQEKGARRVSTAELIAQKTSALSPEKQQEILDFVEFLALREAPKAALRSLDGLWQGLDLSKDDIEETRQGLWGDFPRADI
jgi:hypothetical protein